MKKHLFAYCLLIAAVTVLLLKKQITMNYLDYGEGSYIYASWLFSKGILLYKDFIVPQPPVLFIIGALLLKMQNSIVFVRIFNLFIYLVSNVLFYLLLVKIFKNRLLALIGSALYFIMPVSVSWWPIFIAETYIRVILLALLNIMLPLHRYSWKRIVSAGLLSILLIFTKYTAAPIVIAILTVLLLYDRKTFVRYLIVSGLIFGAALFALISLFGPNFLLDTVFIRRNIEMKPAVSIIYSYTITIGYYLFFVLLDFLLAILAIRSKKYSSALLFLCPVFYMVNLVATAFNGTYNYVFYPVEPLIILGYVYILYYLVSGKAPVVKIRNNFLKGVLFVFLFLGSFSIIFFIQTFQIEVSVSANNADQKTVTALSSYLQKYAAKDQKVIAPPYFAFLSRKTIPDKLTDPFIWLVFASNNKTVHYIRDSLNDIREQLVADKIPILLVDWRLASFNAVSVPIEKYYRKVASYSFVINNTENIDVYVAK